MATNLEQPNSSLARLRDERSSRLIFTVSFIIFLMVAIIARFLPRRWRPYSFGKEDRKSIIEEAKAAASTVVPFAFMG